MRSVVGVFVAKRLEKPPVGLWKINTDVALSETSNALGTGFVCRNGERCVSHMVMSYSQPQRSPLCTKLCIILLACRWVEEKGIGPVIIESDCQRAVQMIYSCEPCFVAEDVLIDEIRNFNRRLVQSLYMPQGNVIELLICWQNMLLFVSRACFGFLIFLRR